jgi:Acyl-CoA carboxylase epsilon subunit
VTAPDAPLTVVAGDATPEELAALLAVVTAREAAAPDRCAPGPLSLWGRPSATLRRAPAALPEGPWQTSFWPR